EAGGRLLPGALHPLSGGAEGFLQTLGIELHAKTIEGITRSLRHLRSSTGSGQDSRYRRPGPQVVLYVPQAARLACLSTARRSRRRLRPRTPARGGAVAA